VSDLDALTEQVEGMLEAVKDAPPGERRRTLQRVMLKRAATLDTLSKEYTNKLAAQWDWCDANPDHPDFERREAAVVRNVKRYEDLFRLLRSVLEAD
jgi:hypothetical protein